MTAAAACQGGDKRRHLLARPATSKAVECCPAGFDTGASQGPGPQVEHSVTGVCDPVTRSGG